MSLTMNLENLLLDNSPIDPTKDLLWATHKQAKHAIDIIAHRITMPINSIDSKNEQS